MFSSLAASEDDDDDDDDEKEEEEEEDDEAGEDVEVLCAARVRLDLVAVPGAALLSVEQDAPPARPPTAPVALVVVMEIVDEDPLALAAAAAANMLPKAPS